MNVSPSLCSLLELECEDSQDQAYDEHGVDILRRHLHMVDHLREEEKMAVEEDLISMNQRWLEEYEALRKIPIFQNWMVTIIFAHHFQMWRYVIL